MPQISITLYCLPFCCSSVAKWCSTPTWWTPGFPVHHLLEFAQIMSIESVMLMLSNHLILCHSLLLLPSIFPSIGSQSVRHDWATSLFPASGSFPKSWLFASGGQSIGISASVLQMNIHGWFPLELTSLISFLSKGLSRVFSSTTVQKHQFFSTQPCLWSNSHIHTWLLEKP